MKGHVRQRGKMSFELRFDVGADPVTGKRRTETQTFRGTKRAAQQRLHELLAAVGQGTFVEPSKATVGEFVSSRIDQWEAAGNITARTAQRYRQLVQNQIVPHIGAAYLQKLTRLGVEAWHTALRNEVAARTIGHAHRLLGQALADAERDGLVVKNVAKLQRVPKVDDKEMVIVRDVPGLIAKLDGERLRVMAIVALTTGMRLGEILAIRECRLDLDGKVIEVAEALEDTQKHGIKFKTPKSKAGRRKITLPDVAVEALREHRRQLLELRVKLGAGKLRPEGLLFSNLEGGPLRPGTVSSDWGDLAERLGMPEITFHALRHTHASQLIDAGVDIVTISKRLGHAMPSITLAVYAHMFKNDDLKAAVAIDKALGGA